MNNYKNYFAFQKEPFPQDVKVSELYHTSQFDGLTERFLYAVDIGAVTVITGDVGTGKSTSLRYACDKLHPSLYKIIPLVATSGTVIEILRTITIPLGLECKSPSLTTLTKTIRNVIQEIALRKQIPVLIIDEAHLMRLEVFAQIHTFMQFDFDSKSLMPMILSGHSSLLDKLMYHTSRPLASRVVGRTHLDGLKLKEMEQYLKHHLEISGIKEQLFSEQAILAIHQSSGGLLRRANLLAKGSLMAAAYENCSIVSPEHARIAATEII